MKIRMMSDDGSNNKGKDDFINDAFRNNNYENPQIIRSSDWNSPENLDLNSVTVSQEIYPHNTAPMMRMNRSPDIIQRVNRGPMTIQNCPCLNLVKCQPCGVIPSLDFSRGSYNFDCPCAPKLNCPICPPLSLIHEIASKKVFINLNRPNKINNWLLI
jgi:hypothetical protein